MNIIDKQDELISKLNGVNVYTDTIVPVKMFPAVVVDIEEEEMYNANQYCESQKFIYMLYAICKVSDYSSLKEARKAVSSLIKKTVIDLACNITENVKYTELVINNNNCCLASVKIEVSI